MAPNKKNKQKNGFYFFMLDLQKQWSRKGRNVKIQDMPSEAHPIWKTLPEVEKAHYNDQAKNYKEEMKNSNSGKLDCFGVPILESQRKAMELDEKHRKMIQNIKDSLDRFGNIYGVSKERFYIIAFNILCKTDENEYIPAEVGVVEYSISEGNTNEYHAFIDPGKIPPGYKFTCQEESDKSHGIPIENFELGNNDYVGIFKKLVSFITKNGQSNQSYRVYTFPDDIEMVELCLDWLRRKSGNKLRIPFEVYDLVHLLVELREIAQNVLGQNVAILPGIAREFLTKPTYDYESGIGCQWHDEQDRSKFCVLGVVKKFGYLLSDYLCPTYEIEFIPGKHLPERADSSVHLAPENYNISKYVCKPESSAPRKFTDSHQSSIVKGRSIFSNDVENEYIYGAEPGVVSQFPVRDDNDFEMQSNYSSSTYDEREDVPCQQRSVASVVRGEKNDDFNLMQDDFPSLPAAGRGCYRGNLMRPTNYPANAIGTALPRSSPLGNVSERNIFDKFKTFGRGYSERRRDP